MCKTLLITDRKLFELMPPELSSLYDDNGGDPDGNALLPSEPVDGDDFAPRPGARLVSATYYSSTTLFSFSPFALEFSRRVECGDVPADEERWEWAHLSAVLGDLLWDTRRWAGYSSKNVFVIAFPMI